MRVVLNTRLYFLNVILGENKLGSVSGRLGSATYFLCKRPSEGHIRPHASSPASIHTKTPPSRMSSHVRTTLALGPLLTHHALWRGSVAAMGKAGNCHCYNLSRMEHQCPVSAEPVASSGPVVAGRPDSYHHRCLFVCCLELDDVRESEQSLCGATSGSTACVPFRVT
jgi:hypothetical protein